MNQSTQPKFFFNEKRKTWKLIFTARQRKFRMRRENFLVIVVLNQIIKRFNALTFTLQQAQIQ